MVAAHLARRFGTEAAEIEALIAAEPSLGEPLVPGLQYVRAEAVHSARHEMVRSLDDILSRRTRARLVDRIACVESADSIAALLAPELGWDGTEAARQAEEFRASVRHEIDSEQSVTTPGGGG